MDMYINNCDNKYKYYTEHINDLQRKWVSILHSKYTATFSLSYKTS